MIIQINTDKTLSGDNRRQEYFTSLIQEELKRFEAHISRIEVHFKDENSHKEGFNDMSCLLEARLEGRKPIAVNSQAGSVELALQAAIEKIKAALDTIIGRMQKH